MTQNQGRIPKELRTEEILAGARPSLRPVPVNDVNVLVCPRGAYPKMPAAPMKACVECIPRQRGVWNICLWKALLRDVSRSRIPNVLPEIRAVESNAVDRGTNGPPKIHEEHVLPIAVRMTSMNIKDPSLCSLAAIGKRTICPVVPLAGQARSPQDNDKDQEADQTTGRG
jgi:hypothetical protein